MISKIRPYLYLAGWATDSVTEKDLKDYGITHTVDVTNHMGILKENPNITNFDICISDIQNGDIKRFFNEIFDYMHDAIQKV